MSSVTWRLFSLGLNTLRPKQKNGRHFADDSLKCIFLNENVWIPNNIPLMFVPKGPINNNPGLVQVMAWRRPGDKPLSEPMLVRLPTHICVTRPQWVNVLNRKVTALRQENDFALQPVMRSFYVVFDIILYKLSNKQSSCRWF